MEAANLFDFQFCNFLGSRPDDCSAADMGFQSQPHSPLLRAPEYFPQHFDDEFHRMIVVVFEDNVKRWQAAHSRFGSLLGFRIHRDIGQLNRITHGMHGLDALVFSTRV